MMSDDPIFWKVIYMSMSPYIVVIPFMMITKFSLELFTMYHNPTLESHLSANDLIYHSSSVMQPYGDDGTMWQLTSCILHHWNLNLN